MIRAHMWHCVPVPPVGTRVEHGDARMDAERDHRRHREIVAEIAGELTLIAERLNEVSMAVLSEAIETGDDTRPDIEKRISRARRTVERAAAQLAGSDGSVMDDPYADG